jgi:hypothetical protein
MEVSLLITVKLCYNCSNCEEILRDQLLVNENKLPPMTILKDNPLFYTRIENLDPIVADQGIGLLQMTKEARPCDSIACTSILFTIFLGHMGSFLIGGYRDIFTINL